MINHGAYAVAVLAQILAIVVWMLLSEASAAFRPVTENWKFSALFGQGACAVYFIALTLVILRLVMAAVN